MAKEPTEPEPATEPELTGLQRPECIVIQAGTKQELKRQQTSDFTSFMSNLLGFKTTWQKGNVRFENLFARPPSQCRRLRYCISQHAPGSSAHKDTPPSIGDGRTS